MNIQNVLQNYIFFALVFVAFLGLPIENAKAATNATMTQAILPVHFVYLEKNGTIANVWSNVSEKDEQYVVKFFDEQKKELPENKKMLLKYVEESAENSVSRQSTQSTQLVEKNGTIEEIKTVV